MNPSTKGRVLGLDVVRATAILCVLLLHSILLVMALGLEGPIMTSFRIFATVLGITAGEVFFVLSGFLIGSMLRSLAPHFRNARVLLAFWQRRWLRTLPNYLLVLVINIGYLMRVTANRPDLPIFAQRPELLVSANLSDVLSYFAFLQNWLWVQPNFFLESWTLAVEVWFYLLFPIVLFLLCRRLNFDRAFLLSALIFLVVPTLLRIAWFYTGHIAWDADYRKITLLRLDSVMFGVLAAQVKTRYPGFWERARVPSFVLGMGLLLACVPSLRHLGAHPFWSKTFLFSAIPLGGALLLPLCAQWRASRENFITRGVRQIALWAYALYLFHTLVMFAILHTIGSFEIRTRPVLLGAWAAFYVLSFLIAALVYRFFEKPMTDLRDRFPVELPSLPSEAAIVSPKRSRLSPLTGYAKNLWETLQGWTTSPWFAYLTISLLQLKRVWGAWLHRDLTVGDTSAHFVFATGWAKQYSVWIQWSPLYTAFYGTVLKLISDVYWATLLHRLVIVFALAILVLAVMRRLLPPLIAWLVAAWWVILPINFDSLYEVHLFAVLLPLAAALLVLHRPGVWGRGAALGILLADMLIVRNEIVIAACLWALVCLIWEVRQARLRRGHGLKAYLLAYGLPILGAFLAFGFFYWRTPAKPSPEAVGRKHTWNVCQIYSFGYQQRHTDWTKSPWTECDGLMMRVFGKSLPSMIETLQSNPRAMLGHFGWNLRLLPAGLQVALFNATSDHVNPDYVHVLLDKKVVLIPSLLALALLTVGLTRLYREKQYWWTAWLKDRVWGWLMMICLAAVMIVVIPMQRPRPSYMFLLTLFLMALLGMCLYVVIQRLRIYRHMPSLVLIAMITLPLFVPAFYTTGGRPLLKRYRDLAPSAEFIGLPNTGLVTSRYPQELCNYFTQASSGGCIGYNYTIFEVLTADASLVEILDRQTVPVTAFVVEQDFLDQYGSLASVQAFLANPEQQGWQLAALQDNSAGYWRLYVNTHPQTGRFPNLFCLLLGVCGDEH